MKKNKPTVTTTTPPAPGALTSTAPDVDTVAVVGDQLAPPANYANPDIPRAKGVPTRTIKILPIGFAALFAKKLRAAGGIGIAGKMVKDKFVEDLAGAFLRYGADDPNFSRVNADAVKAWDAGERG